MTPPTNSLFPTRVSPHVTGRTRPRLLDLFCGAGGCSAGYARAGIPPAYTEYIGAQLLDILEHA